MVAGILIISPSAKRVHEVRTSASRDGLRSGGTCWSRPVRSYQRSRNRSGLSGQEHMTRRASSRMSANPAASSAALSEPGWATAWDRGRRTASPRLVCWRLGGWGLRQVGTSRAPERPEERILLCRSPGHEGRPAAGTQHRADPLERGLHVGEEHHAQLAGRGIERCRWERQLGRGGLDGDQIGQPALPRVLLERRDHDR